MEKAKTENRLMLERMGMTDGEVLSPRETNKQHPSIKRKMGGVDGSRRMLERDGEVGKRRQVVEAPPQLFQKDQNQSVKVWEVSERLIWRMGGAMTAGVGTVLEEKLARLQQTSGNTE